MATKSTTPTRFDAELFESAQTAGARSHRSAAQQLAHWARIGRELEAATGVSQRDIDRVLAGQMSYDDLGDRDQAVVRTAWREGIDADLAALDLRSQFETEGRTHWSEADPTGTVSVHEAPVAKVASRASRRPKA